MIKKYSFYVIFINVLCVTFASFVHAGTDTQATQDIGTDIVAFVPQDANAGVIKPVILERVSAERLAAKQELLHKQLSSAHNRRTFVYSFAALAATGLCAYWAKSYFWPPESTSGAGGLLIQEEIAEYKRAKTKFLVDYCERENRKHTISGVFETTLTAGMGLALAAVILDMFSRGKNVSWNILQRFLGETDSTIYQNDCEVLNKRIGDIGRALESFVRTIKILHAQAHVEQIGQHGQTELGSGPVVSIDQFMSETDKEFLCADVVVSYRAFLDAIEDLIALVLESSRNYEGSQDVGQAALYQEIQKSVSYLTSVVDDCAEYVEYTVNNLDKLGSDKKATARAFVFSKKLSMALSGVSGGFGKMLYGVK
ncbi:MAG: hypothetical protein ABH827_01985 [bacterium]